MDTDPDAIVYLVSGFDIPISSPSSFFKDDVYHTNLDIIKWKETYIHSQWQSFIISDLQALYIMMTEYHLFEVYLYLSFHRKDRLCADNYIIGHIIQENPKLWKELGGKNIHGYKEYMFTPRGIEMISPVTFNSYEEKVQINSLYEFQKLTLEPKIVSMTLRDTIIYFRIACLLFPEYMYFIPLIMRKIGANVKISERFLNYIYNSSENYMLEFMPKLNKLTKEEQGNYYLQKLFLHENFKWNDKDINKRLENYLTFDEELLKSEINDLSLSDIPSFRNITKNQLEEWMEKLDSVPIY